MPIQYPGDPRLLNRFANIGRIWSAANVLKDIGDSAAGRGQVIPADGDRLFLYYIADGTETAFDITCRGGTTSAIFDLYINNVLDSAGYDNYLAVAADITRHIILAQPVLQGLNQIELRVNGRNGLSTNYYILIRGASLQ